MDNSTAVEFLSSLLNKTLIIKIKDQRVFVGTLKCTDKDRNVVLEHTQEFREQYRPSTGSSTSKGPSNTGKARAAFTSRYVGLIVIPGEHIENIELEEFDASLIV